MSTAKPVAATPGPDGHSKYSASAGARWMACPGSMVLEVGKPNGSSIYAAGGTAEHTVASECLLSKADADSYIGRSYKIDGFDIDIDEDRAENVQIYLDNIRDYAAQADSLLVEVKVNYSDWLGTKTAEAWGTSDAVILHGDEIQVHDYKGGRGEEVDPEHNIQMQLYALGALSEYDGLAGDFERVRMVIHQPRVKKAPSEWTCTVDELKLFAKEAKLRVHAVKAAEINAGGTLPNFEQYLVPGEKQCRWCKAKATCPALRADVAGAVALESYADTVEEFADMDVALPNGDDSTEAWLAVSMAKAGLIEGWITAVRAEVERRLLAGGSVTGYKLVQGKQGNRAWTSKVEAEAMLKTFKCKLDEMYRQSLISPTDAEKLLETASPARWKKLAPLITRAAGSPSVAPASDKRAPLVITPTADDFAEVADFDLA